MSCRPYTGQAVGFVSTDGAATILNTTRAHINYLCNRGYLSYTADLWGKERKVRSIRIDSLDWYAENRKELAQVHKRGMRSNVAPSQTKLGYALRKLRMEKGMMMKEVTEAIGVRTLAALSAWELGTNTPPIGRVSMLLDLYDATPAARLQVYELMAEENLRHVYARRDGMGWDH